MRRSFALADHPLTPYSVPSCSTTMNGDDVVGQDRVPDGPDALAACAVVVGVDDNAVGVSERVVGHLRGDVVLALHVFAALQPVDMLEQAMSVMHFITNR